MARKLILSKQTVITLISVCFCAAGYAQDLSISTWRNDDFLFWKQYVFPAFQKIRPNTEFVYDSFDQNVRNETFYRLENNPSTAIIACKPYKMLEDMAQGGHLLPLDSKIDLSPFSEQALEAWRSPEDGKVYCMPFAAVAHAFLYNQEHFAQNNLHPPVTFDDLFTALDTLSEDPAAIPYLMGLRSQWANVVLGHDLIGPAFWQGDQGIERLISGTAPRSEETFLKTFETLKRLRPYMGKEARNIDQLTNLRQFNKGRVSIMPHGSWDISLITTSMREKTGVFAPLRNSTDDPCYLNWHMDIGFGISSKFQNQELAIEFLKFLQTQEAMELFTTHLPGFFLLHKDAPAPRDRLARAYWNIIDQCEPTPRFSRMITKEVHPNFTQELVRVTTQLLLDEISAQTAAQNIRQFFGAPMAPLDR